jgi:hypothetical protein
MPPKKRKTTNSTAPDNANALPAKRARKSGPDATTAEQNGEGQVRARRNNPMPPKSSNCRVLSMMDLR